MKIEFWRDGKGDDSILPKLAHPPSRWDVTKAYEVINSKSKVPKRVVFALANIKEGGSE